MLMLISRFIDGNESWVQNRRSKWGRALGVHDDPPAGNDEYRLSRWERRSRWLDIEWYRWLLRLPSTSDGDARLGWAYDNRLVDYLNRVCCRFRGHPNGQIYYNPGGCSPDEHCKDCGDLC